MRRSQQKPRLNEVFVPSISEAVKIIQKWAVIYQEINISVIPMVINEEAYKHRLRFFLASQPTGEGIFAEIVHGYNKKLKISIDFTI